MPLFTIGGNFATPSRMKINITSSEWGFISEMIKIIDTYPQIDSLFASKQFNFEGWKLYINSLYNQSAQIFIDDLKECLNSGSYVYERDILPIINAVYEHPRLAILYSSFCKVTKNLNQKVIDEGRCEVIQGSVSELPFEDNTFDIVTGFETVYFWPDFVNDCKEVRRVLKDDGIMFICNEAIPSRSCRLVPGL